MKTALDSTRIELTCPHCSNKSSETIRRIKAETQLTCRTCGQVFALDKTQMTTQVAKIEAQLAKTLASFGRLGK